MSSSHFEIHPGAVDKILRGPKSRAQRRKSAQEIADRWKQNIHDLTGATDNSIGVEEEGDETLTTADGSKNTESAWFYLEYGTSKMKAQHPGRRAIKRG